MSVPSGVGVKPPARVSSMPVEHLDLEEALAFDRQIERGAGLGQRRLRQVDRASARGRHRQRRCVWPQPTDVFGEDHAFLAETRRGGIGDVVCDGLHFPHEAGLARKGGVNGVVHRQLPAISGISRVWKKLVSVPVM